MLGVHRLSSYVHTGDKITTTDIRTTLQRTDTQLPVCSFQRAPNHCVEAIGLEQTEARTLVCPRDEDDDTVQ